MLIKMIFTKISVLEKSTSNLMKMDLAGSVTSTK